MTLTGSPSTTFSRPGAVSADGDPTRTVVWIRGEHDIATRAALARTMDDAARLDGAELVVDLSDAEFIDASTIRVLIDARDRLRAASRTLTVRNPSRPARRLLEVCRLEDLIDAPAEVAHPIGPMDALRTWVALAAVAPPTPPRDAPDLEGAEPAHHQLTPDSVAIAANGAGP